MNKQRIYNYLLNDGYRKEDLDILTEKELQRIFILTLVINSTIQL